MEKISQRKVQNVGSETGHDPQTSAAVLWGKEKLFFGSSFSRKPGHTETFAMNCI